MKLCLVAFAVMTALGRSAVSAPSPQDPKEKLKHALKDTNILGTWIYDDVQAGFAKARKTGKPLLVVFR